MLKLVQRQKMDFLRVWNLGYRLFDQFRGDSLSGIDDLSMLSVYDTETGQYHPFNREDLSAAVNAANKKTPMRHQHTYRLYARFHRTFTGKLRFDGVEIIDALALTSPSGCAVRLGKEEVNL